MNPDNRARGFQPNWSTHPGEHLEEHLEVRGLTQAAFARLAGMTPKHVSEIISGKNPVSPETALKLERALGLKAEVWLGLQMSWDLFQARQRKSKTAVEAKPGGHVKRRISPPQPSPSLPRSHGRAAARRGG